MRCDAIFLLKRVLCLVTPGWVVAAAAAGAVVDNEGITMSTPLVLDDGDVDGSSFSSANANAANGLLLASVGG